MILRKVRVPNSKYIKMVIATRNFCLMYLHANDICLAVDIRSLDMSRKGSVNFDSFKKYLFKHLEVV